MDPIEGLVLCGGAAGKARLRALGVRDRELRCEVRAGMAAPAGRGFALPTAPPGLVAAVRLGGVASHSTAAVLHGWPLWRRPNVLTVTIPRGSTRSLRGVRVYRANLAAGDLDGHRACTGPLRTALDCARALSLMDAVCVLDAALRDGSVTERQLTLAAEQARGPGTVALRLAVAHVDPKSESVLESALRVLLLAGNWRMRSQVKIPGVGHVDLLIDDWLVVEADGFEFHSDRGAYREDRRRLNALAERGYVLLRFTWEDVWWRPDWVLGLVQRVRSLTTNTNRTPEVA